MKKRKVIIMILLIILIHSIGIRAEGFKYAEIFDPKQDRIVKVVQLNKEIYDMVAGWIDGVDNTYIKTYPIPSDGYAIRIPLEPAVKVHGKALNALVNEVYIIIPENDPPFFIVFFDDEIEPSSFPFKESNVNILLRALDFKLKIK